MRGKTFAALTFICTLIVLALPSSSRAGIAIDPNLNDTWLGTVGGVRYATDSAMYDAGNSDFIDVEAGCGGPQWHLFGGGSNAAGAPNLSFMEADRPDDYTDVDTLLDDGWLSNAIGTPPARLHSYTACIQHAASYPFRNIANQPSGLRSASIVCPGTQRVTTGGVFIATSGSWETSSYPFDGPDKDTIPDDGWKGGVFDTLGGIGGFSVYAVCSSGLDLHYVKSATATVPVKAVHGLRAACPANEHVVGGGAKLTGSQQMGRLLASFPYDGPDAGKIPDDGWQTRVFNLGGGAKKVTAFAVCLG
jgi:hypothetical protein